MEYYERYIEIEIQNKLKHIGAVVINGPKFCGKTTTCSIFAKSKISFSTKSQIEYASSDISKTLIGDKPKLIDEWQNISEVYDYVRNYIDESEDKFNLFLLTGSATPIDYETIYHSGAGRIVSLKMYPMSLYESKESKGIISLKELFINNDVPLKENDITLDDIAFYICRGGWPLSVLIKNKEEALEETKDYSSNLFEFKNTKNGKYRNKKSEILYMLLRSLARNISTEVRRSVLIEDIYKHEDRRLDEDTFNSYYTALKDLFIINDLEAWNPSLRSRTAITSSTKHFIDPSIATSVLNISPNDLINDMETFGLFFEDLVIRDLTIYSSVIKGEIRHYRDKNGLECDAVLHLNNGDYALIEIKTGGKRLIDEGVKNLLKLKNELILKDKKEPSFLAIIVAAGTSYKTKEGVLIIPINYLKA